MGRANRILRYFPGFMQADEAGKVLGHIAGQIGADLDHAQRLALNVQAAHTLTQARDEIDLHRLAASLGLDPEDLGLLRAYYDAGLFGAHNGDGYAIYIDRLRDIIARTARLYVDGCATIWALLEGASILLAAQTPLDAQGRPFLEHPDRDLREENGARSGFLHRLVIRYRIPVADGFEEHSDYLYLVENPLEDKRFGPDEVRQRERVRVDKGGFFDGTAAVKVTGVAGRTVLPMVINVTTREGIGFDGPVTAGETLLFTREGQAFLNGLDVTARCFSFNGALFDEEIFEPDRTEHPFVVVKPPGALARAFPRPTIVPADRIDMPKLPLGRSDWRFSAREGAFDTDRFNRCVFALPRDPAQLAALPPSGELAIEWQEHAPFAATVLLPDRLRDLAPLLGDDVDLRTWIRAGMDRFRGSGIRLNVDYYTEDWILDHSTLRDADVLTGQGVLFDGTVL